MDMQAFERRYKELVDAHEALIVRKNQKQTPGSGVFDRYVYPVLTADHTPLFWRYDFDPKANPYLMERMGINSVFNAGAIEWEGRCCVVARVESYHRKSFFAVTESANGIDNFRFWDRPIVMPEASEDEMNVYDIRLTRHEDGWIYGTFCAERHDPAQPDNPPAALARAGIARTRDLKTWERLPDLKTPSAQQRNYVLHPEFVDGKYAFYTRPMREFKAAGCSTGIGWALCDDVTNAEIEDESLIIDPCRYHTIVEGKNGQGPPPLKTDKGWLHLAHGVWENADGLRYVLYMFLSDLHEPWRITHRPAGYFMAPRGMERVGDVSDVLFANGWIARDNGDVFIYYGSSDTRVHVVTSTIDRLLDYVLHTPPDGGRAFACVRQRCELIEKNLANPRSKAMAMKS